MNLSKIRNTLLLLLVFFIRVDAQEFSVSVNKKQVGADEQFILTYTLNANGANFRGPNLNEFQVLSGPNQSSNISMMNGSYSQSISFSYYLIPKHEGKINIGPASILCNNKQLQSKNISIEVVKGSGTSAAQPNNPQNKNRNSKTQEYDLGNNLFVRAVASKSRVYEGEAIVVTYKIYTRVNIVDFGVNKIPTFEGFWSEEIASNRNVELHQENIDGLQYQVGEIKKCVLIPQRKGSLTIDPMSLDIVTRIKTQNRNNDFWDQFFGGGSMFGGHQDVKVNVKSKPLKIDVMPLPTVGKPADFTGAVGDFSFNTVVKPNSLKMKSNEPGNLIYTITGKGNLKLIDAPKLAWHKDIEAYEPKTNDKILTDITGQSGKRSFDFVFIPRHSGNFQMPVFNFTFFDPNKAKYVTLNSPELSLEVEKGNENENPSNSVMSSIANKEDVALLANDISYIKTNTTLVSQPVLFFNTFGFWLLFIAPMFLLIFFIIYKNKTDKENSDTVKVNMKNANKVALSKFNLAKQSLDSNDYSQFYKELLNGIYGYLSNKLAIPQSQLNKEEIQKYLVTKNTSQDTILKLNNILNKCEFAQYAPIKNNQDMPNDYQETLNIVNTLEENLK
jgi:hypothetical protein